MQEPIRKVVKEADGKYVRVEIHESGHEEQFSANSFFIKPKEGKERELFIKLSNTFSDSEELEFEIQCTPTSFFLYFELKRSSILEEDYLVCYDALFEEIRQIPEVRCVMGNRLYDCN